MDGMWCVCTARTRAQRACVYSARGWAVMLARGHVGDAHYSGLGTDAQEPRQLRTARDYPRAPPAACEHAMDMRVYVERCLGALRRRAVGDRGAMMLQWHSSTNLRSTKAPHDHRRPTTQRARATSLPSSWNVRFTMALAPRRGRPALASARSLPSISSPPSVQPFKPLPGLGGRRALPTGA